MGVREQSRAAQRAGLLEAAARLLEEQGPEALQARRIASEIGASTQAIYTLFGGMPGLFEALVADGFAQFGAYVDSIPETDDPVADHFVKGAAFCRWALTNPQRYRLMLGLTGGGLRLHSGLEMRMSSPFANFPEGRTAIDVLLRSVDRIQESGRIRAGDDTVVAGQFLSATHGWILLALGGNFDLGEAGLTVLADMSVNLMVGLGDDRETAERSLEAARARIAAGA